MNPASEIYPAPAVNLLEKPDFKTYLTTNENSELSPGDLTALGVLARASIGQSEEELQGALDFATKWPYKTADYVRANKGIEADEDSQQPEVKAELLAAARLAIKSNMAQRIRLTAAGKKSLDEDYLLKERLDKSHRASGDRDAFKFAGSALICAVTRLATGHHVARGLRFSQVSHLPENS